MKKLFIIIIMGLFLVVGVLSSMASENCVCADCGRKCGSGHSTGCIYAPKNHKEPRIVQKVDPQDLKKSDPKPPKLEKSPPPPLEKPKEEPDLLDKFKDKIKKLEPPPGQGSGPTRG